ncbi:MAG TPA: hypothetical protein VJ826_15205 [Candidatus Polarisedimenticolaceae bacterium]|nr:hypothetical protein [Candidatus Polarisedimenticolaceae bacterium]
MATDPTPDEARIRELLTTSPEFSFRYSGVWGDVMARDLVTGGEFIVDNVVRATTWDAS